MATQAKIKTEPFKEALNRRATIDMKRHKIATQLPECDRMRIVSYLVYDGKRDLHNITEFTKVDGKWNKAIRHLRELKEIYGFDIEVVIEY